MTLEFATHVEAKRRALVIVRARYRDAGRKLQSIRTTAQRADADQYLAEHPELLEQARLAVSLLGGLADRGEPGQDHRR